MVVEVERCSGRERSEIFFLKKIKDEMMIGLSNNMMGWLPIIVPWIEIKWSQGFLTLLYMILCILYIVQ